MADTKLFYIDDSGAEATGFVVYSWCELSISHWSTGLEAWLAWRAGLTADHQIPTSFELHATQFANGRGAPSLEVAWNQRKAHRHAVMRNAFATLAAQTWLGVGTVYSKSALRRRHYGRERNRVYLELIRVLDSRLKAAGDYGIVVMDGDGSDESYITAHRQLPLRSRRLIEDPAFQNSHRSQWVQMADLVAYAADQQLLQHPGKRFAWPWYPVLVERDVLGGQRAV